MSGWRPTDYCTELESPPAQGLLSCLLTSDDARCTGADVNLISVGDFSRSGAFGLFLGMARNVKPLRSLSTSHGQIAAFASAHWKFKEHRRNRLFGQDRVARARLHMAPVFNHGLCVHDDADDDIAVEPIWRQSCGVVIIAVVRFR